MDERLCSKCGKEELRVAWIDSFLDACDVCGSMVCGDCCVYTDGEPQYFCCSWKCADECVVEPLEDGE